MDDFPWFTEWNGIFMPVGDALGNSCIMAIVMIILWLVGLLIYLLVKLLLEGFRALGRKEWGIALLCFGTVLTPFLMASGLLALTLGTEAAHQKERELTQQAFQQEMYRLEESPPIDMSATLEPCNDAPYPADDGDRCVMLVVVNHWEDRIEPFVKGNEPENYCNFYFGMTYEDIGSGRSASIPCLPVSPGDSVPSEVCMRFVMWGERVFLNEPHPVVCAQVK